MLNPLKVPIDEAVANLRFDMTNKQTPDQLNQISISGRDKVRESFQKYLEEQHNGMPIKAKLLRQMAETEVSEAVELVTENITKDSITQIKSAETNEAIKLPDENHSAIVHPDSLQMDSAETINRSQQSDKISEVIIIGKLFNFQDTG